MMIIPPIVGVPDFFTIWSIGPSCLIGPVISILEKNLINGPPIRNTIINEVIKDKPVLKVRYLKTFKNEYCSINEVKNSSINIGISAVEKIIKNSIDKKKLDKIYISSIEEAKKILKNKSI